MEPRVIFFEGVDGCGKTTQLKMLSDYLTANGIDHVCDRLPGGGVYGEKIRDLLMDCGPEMTREAQIMLFMACYFELLHNAIIPNLDAGKVVLIDRSPLSTFAYQFNAYIWLQERRLLGGYLMKLLLDCLKNDINGFPVDYLIFYGSPDKFLDRIHKRNDGNIYDADNQEKLKSINSFYDGLSNNNGWLGFPAIININAMYGQDAVHSEILQKLGYENEKL